MARTSRAGRGAKKAPPSPARIAALLGAIALLLLVGFKLYAYLGSPAGRRFLDSADDHRRADDATAVELARALEPLGIDGSVIDRRSAPRVVTGHRGAERWTISVPRGVALVECNLAVTRAARELGLAIQDAWEHRHGEGGWPALSISLAAAEDGQASPGPSAAAGGSRSSEQRLAEHELYRLTFVEFPPAERGLIAVVIDDWGPSWSDTARRFLAFPAPLTLSVLPGYKASRRIAEAAKERGHEVILHLPMEPEGKASSRQDPELILLKHKPAEVKARIRRALKSVGSVSGISNHMGSLATTDAELMRLVLEETDRRGLYFFDSRTTPRSVVDKVALRVGTPCVVNRLFLDNDRSPEKIRERLDEAIEVALATHEVAVIGHPHAETLEVLLEALPRLEEQGLRLVRLSELVPRPLVD